MKYKKISLILFCISFIASIFSCNHTKYGEVNECTVEEFYGRYRIKSEQMGIKGLQHIDLSAVWDKTDEFEYAYLGINYRDTGYVYLELVNNGDELIRAEELVEYYASIWSDMDDDVIQFIELRDLSYTIHTALDIEEGIIKYPQSNHRDDSNMIKYFNSISKKQLIQAIKKNYSNIENNQEVIREKYVFLNYANKYTPNKSFGNPFGTFCILDGIHKIVCTYNGKDGEYSKSIYYSETHGN